MGVCLGSCAVAMALVWFARLLAALEEYIEHIHSPIQLSCLVCFYIAVFAFVKKK